MPPDHPYLKNICDYKTLYEKWSEVFGSTNIKVRLFEKDSFVQGSLLRDFVTTAGLPVDLDYVFPSMKNTSLDRLGLHLLAALNRRIPRFIDNKPNPIRNKLPLSDLFEQYFSSGPKYHPSDLQKQQYNNFFKDSNEFIRAKFFPEKSSLFSEKEVAHRNKETDPFDFEDCEKIADFISYFLNRYADILTLDVDKIRNTAAKIEHIDASAALVLVELAHKIHPDEKFMIKMIRKYKDMLITSRSD